MVSVDVDDVDVDGSATTSDVGDRIRASPAMTATTRIVFGLNDGMSRSFDLLLFLFTLNRSNLV